MAKDKKVVSLVSKTDDAKYHSPAQMLQECIDDLEKGERWENKNKMFVVAIEDTDTEFNVHFNNAKCQSTEMLAALKIMESKILRYMGYLADGDDIADLRDDLGL